MARDMTPEERRKQSKEAAVGGLVAVFGVAVCVVLLGQPLAVIPLLAAAALLVCLYTGRLDGD